MAIKSIKDIIPTKSTLKKGLEISTGITEDFSNAVFGKEFTKTIENDANAIIGGFSAKNSEGEKAYEEFEKSFEKVKENYEKYKSDGSEILEAYKKQWKESVERLKEQYDGVGDWWNQEIWEDYKKTVKDAGKRILNAVFGTFRLDDINSLDNKWKVIRIVIEKYMNYDHINKIDKDAKVSLKTNDLETDLSPLNGYAMFLYANDNPSPTPLIVTFNKGGSLQHYKLMNTVEQMLRVYTLNYTDDDIFLHNYIDALKSLSKKKLEPEKHSSDSVESYNAAEPNKTKKMFTEDRWKASDERPITYLLHSGDDLLSNLFSAVFFYYDEAEVRTDLLDDVLREQEGKYRHSNNVRVRSIITKDGFGVRFGKIEIPQAKNDSFDISIGEQTIKKVRSSKVVQKTASFTFRLDNNLEWLDFFNKASGINNNVVLTPHYLINDAKWDSSLPEWRKENYRFVTRSYSSARKKGSVLGKRLCLMIATHDSIRPVDLLSSNKPPYEARLKPSWAYIFEDIKILGVSDSLSYSMESGEPADVTVNFIFKNLRRLTKKATIGEGVYLL